MSRRRTMLWSCVSAMFWAGVWVLLNGRLTAGALVFALVLGVLTSRLASAGTDHPRSLLGAAWALTRLGGIFLRELVISNLQQLRIVLRPRIDIQPRWLELETKLETDFGRSLLAVLISMTPGTLTCEVSRSRLTVHILDASDPEAVARQLQERLESPDPPLGAVSGIQRRIANRGAPTMIDLLHHASEFALALAAFLALWRISRGPSAFDRVLGLELIALIVVGFLVLEARRLEIRLYLDAALALALFSFVGTVLLARVLEEDRSDD